MVKVHNDTVILRSKKYTDVTINATTMYNLNELTHMYDIMAIVCGKVGELTGDIVVYPYFNILNEQTAQYMCKQFVRDIKIMALNQPDRYSAYLKSFESIVPNLPADTSSMEGLSIQFSIPHKYQIEDNPLTYRN